MCCCCKLVHVSISASHILTTLPSPCKKVGAMSSSRRVLYAGGQTTSHWHHPQSDDDTDEYKRIVAANHQKAFVAPSVGFIYRVGSETKKENNNDSKTDITYKDGCCAQNGGVGGYWQHCVFIGELCNYLQLSASIAWIVAAFFFLQEAIVLKYDQVKLDGNYSDGMNAYNALFVTFILYTCADALQAFVALVVWCQRKDTSKLQFKCGLWYDEAVSWVECVTRTLTFLIHLGLCITSYLSYLTTGGSTVEARALSNFANETSVLGKEPASGNEFHQLNAGIQTAEWQLIYGVVRLKGSFTTYLALISCLLLARFVFPLVLLTIGGRKPYCIAPFGCFIGFGTCLNSILKLLCHPSFTYGETTDTTDGAEERSQMSTGVCSPYISTCFGACFNCTHVASLIGSIGFFLVYASHSKDTGRVYVPYADHRLAGNSLNGKLHSSVFGASGVDSSPCMYINSTEWKAKASDSVVYPDAITFDNPSLYSYQAPGLFKNGSSVDIGTLGNALLVPKSFYRALTLNQMQSIDTADGFPSEAAVRRFRELPASAQIPAWGQRYSGGKDYLLSAYPTTYDIAAPEKSIVSRSQSQSSWANPLAWVGGSLPTKDVPALYHVGDRVEKFQLGADPTNVDSANQKGISPDEYARYKDTMTKIYENTAAAPSTNLLGLPDLTHLLPSDNGILLAEDFVNNDVNYRFSRAIFTCMTYASYDTPLPVNVSYITDTPSNVKKHLMCQPVSTLGTSWTASYKKLLNDTFLNDNQTHIAVWQALHDICNPTPQAALLLQKPGVCRFDYSKMWPVRYSDTGLNHYNSHSQQTFTGTPMYACSNNAYGIDANDMTDLGYPLHLCALVLLVASILECLARLSYILCTWCTAESAVTSDEKTVIDAFK